MDTQILRAVVAGACFGAWPFFLNRSGAGGTVGSLLLLIGTLAFVIPFAYASIRDNPYIFTEVNWIMVAAAAVTSACGLLAFNSMLSQATPTQSATLFVLAVLVQASVPAVIGIIADGRIGPIKALGFMFAGVGAALLTRVTN